MNGRRLVIGFLVLLAGFTLALIYFQFFAFYERSRGDGAIVVAGQSLPAEDIDRIDAPSSPLKLRSCFRVEPGLLEAAPSAPAPTPLNPPPWFRCFDTAALTADLASGRARAYLADEDTPSGFDRIVAIYPDGRGYEWRQLNARFTD